MNRFMKLRMQYDWKRNNFAAKHVLHGEAIILGLIHEQLIAESILNTDSKIRKELILRYK